MDYEKKYKDAIKRAGAVLKVALNQKEVYGCITTIFPELEESEDEKSKNWILEYLYDGLRKSDEQFKDQFKAAIAWLEKQGGQKYSWSEDDEVGLRDAMWAIEKARDVAKDESDMGNLWYAERWLKSVKERMKGE